MPQIAAAAGREPNLGLAVGAGPFADDVAGESGGREGRKDDDGDHRSTKHETLPQLYPVSFSGFGDKHAEASSRAVEAQRGS